MVCHSAHWPTTDLISVQGYCGICWTVEKRLPFCVSGNAIEYFRHAIALDKRHVMFTPTYFHVASQHKKIGGVSCELKNHVDGLHVNATNVEEVFFAGAHCGTLLVFRRTIYRLFINAHSDVGGRSVPNGEHFALSRIVRTRSDTTPVNPDPVPTRYVSPHSRFPPDLVPTPYPLPLHPTSDYASFVGTPIPFRMFSLVLVALRTMSSFFSTPDSCL